LIVLIYSYSFRLVHVCEVLLERALSNVHNVWKCGYYNGATAVCVMLHCAWFGLKRTKILQGLHHFCQQHI
jgi:hypothetical protein